MRRHKYQLGVLGGLVIVTGLLAGCTRVTVLPPDQLLVNGVAKILEANSFTITTNATLNELPVQSKVFTKKFEAVTAESSIDFVRDRDGNRLAATINLTDRQDEQLTTDIRVVDNVAYVLLEQVPDTGNLDLSSLTKTAFYLPITDNSLWRILTEPLSAFERSSLAQVVRDTPDLFTNIVELPEEELAGVATRHAQAQLNPDAINRLFAKLSALQGVPARQFVFRNLEQVPLELWIDKGSGALLQVKGEFTDVQDRTGTVAVRFTNLGESLSITEHTDAAPLTYEELIRRLQGSATDPDEIETSDDATTEDTTQDTSDTDTQNDTSNTEPSQDQDNTPNTDSGNTTVPYAPDVPFPIQ